MIIAIDFGIVIPSETMATYADLQNKSLTVAKAYIWIGIGLLLLMLFFAFVMFLSFWAI